MKQDMKQANRILALVSKHTDVSTITKMAGISRLITRKRSYATEVDFHTDNPESAEILLRSITNVIEFRILNEEAVNYSDEYFESVLRSEGAVIDKARDMFREERYWEAHTVLEDLWKASEGMRKKTLQGVIVIAASLTHYQMGEFNVAERMYRKGIALIKEGSGFSPEEYGYREDFSYPCLFPDVL